MGWQAITRYKVEYTWSPHPSFAHCCILWGHRTMCSKRSFWAMFALYMNATGNTEYVTGTASRIDRSIDLYRTGSIYFNQMYLLSTCNDKRNWISMANLNKINKSPFPSHGLPVLFSCCLNLVVHRISYYKCRSLPSNIKLIRSGVSEYVICLYYYKGVIKYYLGKIASWKTT